jgi:putative zinc finger/helix-turn-helix YgiT family protein
LVGRTLHHFGGILGAQVKPAQQTRWSSLTSSKGAGLFGREAEQFIRQISDRELNLLKAKVEGLLEPQAVRRIRKRLKLTQKDAGRLIGGGPNAFQKYESGDVLPSHAVTSALLLLNRDPKGLEVLKRHANAQ